MNEIDPCRTPEGHAVGLGSLWFFQYPFDKPADGFRATYLIILFGDPGVDFCSPIQAAASRKRGRLCPWGGAAPFL